MDYKIDCAYDELVDAHKLVAHPKNNNRHSVEQIQRLAKIIDFQGMRSPIVVSKLSGFITKGHGRLDALKLLGWDKVPVNYQDYDDEAQEYADLTADNEIARWAEFDWQALYEDIKEFDGELDLDMLGIDNLKIDGIDDIDDPYSDGEKGSMQKNFIAPPFSVLDAKQGYWKERKNWWLAKGLKSELGRSDLKTTVATESIDVGSNDGGGSVFDPVLTELLYSWFSKKNDLILDPFAGGSVRGVVCSLLGRQYIGNDLRSEQVEANRTQALELCEGCEIMPVWSCGDSLKIKELAKGVEADMVFSCPPYADLEVYSDQKEDITNMPYGKFKEAYLNIIKNTCDMLKEDRFACFVVGEVRGKNGLYYNFIGDTIKAFKQAGLEYYNEIVYVTPTGSLPLRAGRSFKAGRKVGKAHQNVLVFVKGDAKKATLRLGDVEVMEVSEGEDGE